MSLLRYRHIYLVCSCLPQYKCFGVCFGEQVFLEALNRHYSGSQACHRCGKLRVAEGEGPEVNEGKEETKMTWEIVVALALAIPVILFPAAYVGYLTIGGTVAAVRGERREKGGVAVGHAGAK